MSVRKISVKLGVASVAVAGLAFTALAPANADAGPSTSPNLGTDIIGVGSDTTQWVMDQLTTDYNKAHTSGARLINYDACLGNTSAGAPGLGDNPDGSGFPCGADHTGTKAGVKRDEGVVDPAATGGALPSGSGDGRTLLRTSTDKLFNDVAFGRSSGPINTADLSAGELALPFAVDKIVVATNPNGPAPASLSGEQLLKIFNGTYTNWNQVGGKNGVIHAYLPKSGSSTLNAFEAFLAQLDGVTETPGSDNDPASHSAAKQTWQGPSGTITDTNWNTGATNVEEHDPSVIIADKNAIEPFSYGRAQLANKQATSVRIEGGWSADRELYNVVRGSAISGASTTPFLYGSDNNVLEGIFSNSGWICTDPTAQADITNAGFWPLSAGTCGVANKNSLDTINGYASNGVGEGAATTTSAQYIGGSVFVTVAAKTGSAVPTGKVQVVVAAPTTPGQTAAPASYTTTVALGADGTAQVKLPATVSGRNVVDVSYLPTGFGSLAAAGGHSMMGSSYDEFNANVASGVAKVATATRAAAKPAVLATAAKSTKVTVVVSAKGATPAGSIKITEGRKVVGTGTLKAGKVVITVKGSKLNKGKNKLTVVYTPKGGFMGSKGAVTITRKK